jgi:transcriptional regulator with XRE-family HTH domain
MKAEKNQADGPDDLASRLREARRLAGLSQAQVAAELKVHRPTISEIEAGRRTVNTDEIKQFAEIYGVTTTWLLGESESGIGTNKLLIAARELGKIKEEDLNRLVKVIQMLKTDK